MLWSLGKIAVAGDKAKLAKPEPSGMDMKQRIFDFASSLLTACTHSLPHLTPQALSNITGAVASLSLQAHSSVVPLLQQLGKRTDDLNPQEIANTLHALAKMGASYPMKLLEKAGQCIDAFTSQQLANVVWATAKFEVLL